MEELENIKLLLITNSSSVRIGARKAPANELVPSSSGRSRLGEEARVDEHHPHFINYELYIHEHPYTRPRRDDFRAGRESMFGASLDKEESLLLRSTCSSFEENLRFPKMCTFILLRRMREPISHPGE